MPALAALALVGLALAGAARRRGSARSCCEWRAPTPPASTRSGGGALCRAGRAPVGGRLRIEVESYPRRVDGSVDEAGLLRAVAGGEADLGWAHTASFDAVGVDAFDALEVPMLIDSYPTETAVIRSALATRMLAGVSRARLTGLALLAGPLDRLIDTSGQLRGASDIRGHAFAVRLSPVARMAVRAVAVTPWRWSQGSRVSTGMQTNLPGPQAFAEDDLDSIFFDRYGGRCDFGVERCDTSRPWVNDQRGARPERRGHRRQPRTAFVACPPRSSDG